MKTTTTIFIGKCLKNNEFIYINTSNDVKSSIMKAIVYMGNFIAPEDLPLEQYEWQVKFFHKRNARTALLKELESLLIKYTYTGLNQNTIKLVLHDMHLWCNNPLDLEMFFEAHGLVVPDFFPALLQEVKSPFPDHLAFTNNL